MIITNVNISQNSQEILIKAAAEKRMSVEELASVYSMVGWVSLSLNLIFVIS